MKNPLVSIIVINYNGEKIIKKCLDRILHQTYRRTEIIVVDNNSLDKSRVILKKYEKIPNVKIIKLDKNIGCPGARNAGVEYCHGKYAAFMDNDGFAHKDWLIFGIKKMELNKNIGAIAPLVLFENNKNIINGIGGFLDKFGRGKDYFYKAPLKKGQKYPEYALWPMGCGMIIRSEILKDNKFDEILFNYYDDTDMGIKIWCQGFKVATEPKSLVYHLQSESEKHNKNKTFLCERNRIYTHLKYLPLKHLPRWILSEISLEIIWTGELKINFFYIWFWNFKHFKKIIYHRKKFKADKIFPAIKT